MRFPVLPCLLLSLLAGHASAQLADTVRGGWTADIDGALQVYLFKLRGNAITGVHCRSDCRNPANLALIESGRIDGDRIEFTVYRETADRRPIRTAVSGRLVDGVLRLGMDAPDRRGGTVSFELHKTPPPAPAPAAAGFAGARGRGPNGGNAAAPPPRPRQAYDAPGPAEPLTPERVTGLWIAGTGPAKQNFIFRQAGNGLYGMVCGPCDDTNAMAPLDGVVIDGTKLHFNIVHEDWGIGIEDGVFSMVSVGTIAASELHFTAVRDTDASGREAVMTLLGPVEYQEVE